MPKTTIEFKYSIGERVRIVEIDRTGTVTSFFVDSEGVQYRVAYWSDGNRRSEVMFEFEIKAIPEAPAP